MNQSPLLHTIDRNSCLCVFFLPWWWCASHRPGIPISEHSGLFLPLHGNALFSCELLQSGACCIGVAGLKWTITSVSRLLWQAEVTHIQKEPCLFCMVKWDRGWRVATETLGSGQTSPHFSTYSMLGICIAFAASLIARIISSCFFFCFFSILQSAWWQCSLFEDTPPSRCPLLPW